jgi:hypothetical protein
MFLLKCCISRSPYADVAINWIRQKRLSSNQCTLFHDLIFHPIWSRAHWSLAVLWRIVSSGRFIGRLARNHALLRRLLTVRLLMRPLTIHWHCSVFVVLNGSCLASLLRSHFQRPFCPLAFFHTPGLVHTLLQSNNDRVAYIESFSSLSCRTYHPLPFQSLVISLYRTGFDVPYWNTV